MIAPGPDGRKVIAVGYVGLTEVGPAFTIAGASGRERAVGRERQAERVAAGHHSKVVAGRHVDLAVVVDAPVEDFPGHDGGGRGRAHPQTSR